MSKLYLRFYGDGTYDYDRCNHGFLFKSDYDPPWWWLSDVGAPRG